MAHCSPPASIRAAGVDPRHRFEDHASGAKWEHVNPYGRFDLDMNARFEVRKPSGRASRQ